MREFFKGWRRKAGCVTLVMACVFMVGWMRSSAIQDVITFQSGPQAAEYLMSLDGKLVLERIQTGGPSKTLTKWFTNKRPIRFGSLNSPVVHWRWRWLGFGMGEIPADRVTGTRTALWAIPYWSITIPLTAISAFLLLSKPSKSTTKKTIEPTANERGATS